MRYSILFLLLLCGCIETRVSVVTHGSGEYEDARKTDLKPPKKPDALDLIGD